MPGWINFLITSAVIAAIFSMLAIALNLHWGVTGLVNFGHVGFFAFGAFVTGLAMLPSPEDSAGFGFGNTYLFGLGLPWVIAAVLAVVGTALFALIIGFPALRAGLNEAYLGITTFALAEILLLALSAEERLVNGYDGLRGLDRPWGDLVERTVGLEWYPLLFLGLASLVVFACWWFATRLTASPMGRILKAIREDTIVVEALGHNTLFYRLRIFVIGAGMAGLAGSIWAVYVRSIAPQNFLPAQTFLVWAALIVGGAGNMTGSIVGAVAVIGLLNQGSRFLPEIADPQTMAALRQIAIGLLLILVLRFRPEGLVPERLRSFGSRNDRSAESA